MVILPILKFDFEETDKLQDTIRGSWIWFYWKMKKELLERYSRQIIIKDIGFRSKKISSIKNFNSWSRRTWMSCCRFIK